MGAPSGTSCGRSGRRSLGLSRAETTLARTLTVCGRRGCGGCDGRAKRITRLDLAPVAPSCGPEGAMRLATSGRSRGLRGRPTVGHALRQVARGMGRCGLATVSGAGL